MSSDNLDISSQARAPTSSGNAGVLVVDENQFRGELYEHWLDDVPCTLRHSPEEALESLSKSHLVLCFQGEMEAVTDFVDSVRSVVPYVRVLQLASREAPFAAVDRGFDDSLVEPFGQETFTETVHKLYRRALYDLKTHQFYRLSASYVAAQRKGPAEPDERERLASLESRIGEVEREMKSLASRMDSTDFDALVRAIQIRSEYATEPNREPSTDLSSKYHPRSCPSCGLDWGVRHGNDLGNGFERIAAFVFECARCGRVVKTSAGEYDKIL